MCHVKPKFYEALKTFDERVQTAFPGAGFSLTDPFGGNDLGSRTNPSGNTYHPGGVDENCRAGGGDRGRL
jgi:hypothetical protein